MKQIVLAGGGHANALALLKLRGQPGITLVSEHEQTPYSGMLPGAIAGVYAPQQCFIDLPALAAHAGARFARARVAGMQGRRLLLESGDSMPFDVLSLNTGACPAAAPAAPAPATSAVTVADDDSARAVKPIAPFLAWLARCEQEGRQRWTVVGGGAGGVETALALARRFAGGAARVRLLGRRLLPAAPEALRRHAENRLHAAGVLVALGEAARMRGGNVLLADGRTIAGDAVVFATPVCAPAWFARTGLARDAAGFLRVNQYLQSVSDAAVFISGDAASHAIPLPKAGVMATRQGRILADNLLTAAKRRQKPLRRFSPNSEALFILGDGDGRRAIATRNGLTASGRWAWRLKEHLDFSFMKKVQKPPPAAQNQ